MKLTKKWKIRDIHKAERYCRIRVMRKHCVPVVLRATLSSGGDEAFKNGQYARNINNYWNGSEM